MIKHLRSTDDWSEKSIGAKGFTLIELLIVIIILGILAGIVVLGVNNLTTTSKSQSCKTEVKTVESAQAAYFAKTSTANNGNGTYADSVDTLHTDGALKDLPATEYGIATDTSGAVTNTCP